jgi:ribonuclease HII
VLLVAEASVEEIDRLNILQATLLAMQRAVAGLRLKPTKVLVDGNRLPRLDVLAEAIVKGDAQGAGDLGGLDPGQGAARPLVRRGTTQFPQYGFAAHKGYGTAAHLAALRAHGACPEHRRSFAPVAEVLT